MNKAITSLQREAAANRSRYFFTLSGNEDTFKVIAIESRAGNLHALSTDYEVVLTLSAEQTAEGWKPVIRDHVHELPRLADPGLLHYREPSGQVRSEDTLYHLQSRTAVLTGGIQLNDHNYRTPSTALPKPARQSESARPGPNGMPPHR